MLLKLEKVSYLFTCAYQGGKDDLRLTKRVELLLDKGDRKRERSLNFLQSSFLAHLAKRWHSPGTPILPANKTNRHHIIEI